MLLKQCQQCGNVFSLRHGSCRECGWRVISISRMKAYIEKSRLRLALTSIALILIVGMGWFLRMESGSRIPLFIVFFLVAPLVPWILKHAYKHAAPPDEDEHNKE